jgi:hypothetical protein
MNGQHHKLGLEPPPFFLYMSDFELFSLPLQDVRRKKGQFMLSRTWISEIRTDQWLQDRKNRGENASLVHGDLAQRKISLFPLVHTVRSSHPRNLDGRVNLAVEVP